MGGVLFDSLLSDVLCVFIVYGIVLFYGSITNPVELHVHNFRLFLFDYYYYYAMCTFVVGLQWC